MESWTDISTLCLRRTRPSCFMCRFLVARSNSVHQATCALRKTLQWRARFKPETIHWDDVKECARGGRLELLSQTDSLSRPILLYRLRCATQLDS